MGFSLTLRGTAEVWLDGQLQYRFGAIETADGREQLASFRNLQSLIFHRDSTNAGGTSRHHLAIRYANTTFSKPAWTGFRPAFSFTLGEERAKDLFQSVVEKSPQEVIAHLNRAGETWANGRTQQDDVTFVMIKIK